ncbi:hypothetical protein BURMUCF1_A0705 [Burkholderia multivorans ATCC BAA-247]|nr:hypothetical protein BURMUCF1_A0705 [Burkholderia multivorans ATCC BAA-247]
MQFDHSSVESINRRLMLGQHRCDSYTRLHPMRDPRRARRPRL